MYFKMKFRGRADAIVGPRGYAEALHVIFRGKTLSKIGSSLSIALAMAGKQLRSRSARASVSLSQCRRGDGCRTLAGGGNTDDLVTRLVERGSWLRQVNVAAGSLV
jgi:hypothetical protein